ncbi:hypothetical protein MRX96_020914 [Rhipicephalus microplus]
MQSVLAWSPLDRRHFSYYPSQLLHKRIATDPLAPHWGHTSLNGCLASAEPQESTCCSERAICRPGPTGTSGRPQCDIRWCERIYPEL